MNPKEKKFMSKAEKEIREGNNDLEEVKRLTNLLMSAANGMRITSGKPRVNFYMAMVYDVPDGKVLMDFGAGCPACLAELIVHHYIDGDYEHGSEEENVDLRILLDKVLEKLKSNGQINLVKGHVDDIVEIVDELRNELSDKETLH